MLLHAILAVATLLPAAKVAEATSQRLAEEKALLDRLAIGADRLKPLAIETPLVEDGKARAWICHADEPAWREAALVVQRAIREATGVELPLKTDQQVTAEQFAGNHLILLGHLDNHRWVARLYHNFFVCLDQGFTGRNGYEIRTVHDPFGTRHNYVLVGGSTAEGTRKAAAVFAELLRKQAAAGRLKLGRLIELKFDAEGRKDKPPEPLSDKQQAALVANGRRLLFSPGQGRSGVSVLIQSGIAYHRSGDPAQAAVCREMFLALDEYYRTDPYILSTGMGRYDRDFRDAYTYEVAIVWDLVEECGLFSDQERLTITNLLTRLAMECCTYQGWNKPGAVERWAANTGIVHNHLTFPALSVLFVGNYLKRHYQVDFVDDWLAVARGIFNGQKHCCKPMEDSASYQWLPVIHTMIYSLAENDLTFFEEGHAREAAEVALMVMDNAGYGAAYGDHPGLTDSAGVPPVLRVAGWYYRSPGFVWGADLSGRSTQFCVGQPYDCLVEPQPPADHVGMRVFRVPPQAYELANVSPKGPGPNIPIEQAFDKLALRGGWNRHDEYLLLDGYGRGNHMHFDVNAIISYAAGGRPLLVDGEYIKSLPKYHNSLVIVRDGQTDPAPAVAGLGRADSLGSAAYARTWVQGYSGARWTRTLLWQRGDYLLVRDEVRADEPGHYTLRCCWRPWGEVALRDGLLEVKHKHVRLLLANVDGAAASLERMKDYQGLPISRLSQEVSLELKRGEAYHYVNVLRAEPLEQAEGVAARQVADDVVLVRRGPRRDVVAFQPGDKKLPGLRTDAEAVVLGESRWLLVGGTRLQSAEEIYYSTATTSCELDLKAGKGTLVSGADVQVKLRLRPGCRLKAGEQSAAADASGVVGLKLSAGRHVLEFDPCPIHASLAVIAEQVAQRQARTSPLRTESREVPALPLAWRLAGIEPPPEKLPVKSIRSSVPPGSNYRLENLIDGGPANSGSSAGWSRGKSCELTLELPEETEVRRVALCEWQGNSLWGIGRREVQLSSDGFQKDIRSVPADFAPGKQVESGNSLNVRMVADVNQRARQIRIKLAPAADNKTVYLSEVELLGAARGKRVPINALATGDLDGDGTPEVIVAGASGQVMAVAADGSVRWSYDTQGHTSVDALATADLDGSGRSEVLFGGAGARLGVLGGDGRLRWQVQPPRYRGLNSDVKTVFAGNLNGDGRPAVICGCLSWQYFAYDGKGQKLWQSVIYAHSASVGCAADLDGDGKDEIIAGNVYYQLNVLGPDGKRRWVGNTVTPEMTAVAAGSVSADPRPAVFCGMDGGDLICFDTAGKELWRANLGDKVNRIILADLDGDGVQEILCAADSAQVVALKGDGKVLWRAFLPGGSRDVAVGRPGPGLLIAATAGSGGLVLLDAAGRVQGQAPTSGQAEKVVLLGDRAVVATAEGSLEAFQLPAKK